MYIKYLTSDAKIEERILKKIFDFVDPTDLNCKLYFYLYPIVHYLGLKLIIEALDKVVQKD